MCPGWQGLMEELTGWTKGLKFFLDTRISSKIVSYYRSSVQNYFLWQPSDEYINRLRPAVNKWNPRAFKELLPLFSIKWNFGFSWLADLTMAFVNCHLTCNRFNSWSFVIVLDIIMLHAEHLFVTFVLHFFFLDPVTLQQ